MSETETFTAMEFPSSHFPLRDGDLILCDAEVRGPVEDYCRKAKWATGPKVCFLFGVKPDQLHKLTDEQLADAGLMRIPK